MRSQGFNMNNKIQKAKMQLPFLRCWEQKWGMAHSTINGVGRPPKPLLQPEPPISSHLTPFKGPAHSPGGVSKGTCCLFSLRLQLEEPLPEFLT